jgi:FtsH-binding integral membrane protein
MEKLALKFGFMTVLLLSFFSLALAQTASSRPPIIPPGSTDQNQGLLLPHSPANTVEENYIGGTLLPNVTTTIIAAAGAAAVLFIIIGGIQMLTAYGSDEKIGKAKKTITWAIVGLLIAILSYAIVSIISGIRL